jgi:PAS domain S-box-containing protein
VNASEIPLNVLAEAAADGVILIDDESTILFVNPAAGQIFGYQESEIVGKNLTSLMPEHLRQIHLTALKRYISTGERHISWRSVELTGRHKSGREFPIEVSFTEHASQGKRFFTGFVRDITDRKRAEEALQASEQRLQAIVDNTTAVIFVKDLELRYILVNREYERRHQVQRDQIRGKTDFDIFPHDVAETLRANDRQVIEARTPIQFEETVPVAQGERHYVVVKFLLRDSSAKPYAVCGIATDITELKRAEGEIRQLNATLEKRVTERTIELVRSNDQLKRAEEQLRKRGEQVQIHRDVLLELARSDKSDLEKALQKICSLSATTLEVARVSYWSLQQNDSAIVCEVLYLRDAESCDAEFKGTRLGFSDCPAYFEALATTRPIIADRALMHPATSCLAENYLKSLGISSMLDVPVWVGGELVGVLCHEHTGPPRDWSAEEVDFVSGLAVMVSLALEESSRAHSEHLLRESEERFSKAFRASPVNITILRLSDKRFVEANDAFVRWLGLSRDRILGHDSKELGIWLNLDERAKFLADLERNGSLRDIECRLQSRRGTVHTIAQSAEIIEINREPHMLIIGLDITARKQAEAELLRTLAREKELGQLRSNFVSVVSHEFRTPLGIIQSSAEILEDYLEQLEPAERKAHLQSIRNNTSRMARLMEEALLIGSLDAGKMEFKAALLDPRTFVRRLVDEVLSATGRRCPIKFSLHKVPAAIQADERLLRHIFTNLLTNAVKYSDAGQVVWFEIGRDKAEIVCLVRDQGLGIPEADQKWLFNAFHRGHNVSDRPGTGLGLVIVKRCVDLHGGKIKVESKLHEGTIVTVRLPI